MNFVNLHKCRETDKNEQLENYFTELIAFMCNTSSKFKEIYLYEFLGVHINSKIQDWYAETQKSVNDRGFIDLVFTKIFNSNIVNIVRLLINPGFISGLIIYIKTLLLKI